MEEVEDEEEEVEESVPNWAKSSKLADLLTWTCLLMLQFSSRLDFWSLQKTRLPFSSSLLLLLTPSPLFLVLSGQHSFVKAIAATFRLSSSQGNNYFVFVSFFSFFHGLFFFLNFFFLLQKRLLEKRVRNESSLGLLCWQVAKRFEDRSFGYETTYFLPHRCEEVNNPELLYTLHIL